jgi:hypothetical protein
MFNSLIHGEALFEILIESGNPYADGPLTEDEQSRLKGAGLDPAALDAMVIGRVVMGGRGVWALAGDRLVVLGMRYRDSVDTLARADVTYAEAEAGRYGQTVRLQTRQGRWAMYGVDLARATRLLQALSAHQAAHA